jgi:hypothetical protein
MQTPGERSEVTFCVRFTKAEGVVGVDIHEGSHGWQTHVIEFFLRARNQVNVRGFDHRQDSVIHL